MEGWKGSMETLFPEDIMKYAETPWEAMNASIFSDITPISSLITITPLRILILLVIIPYFIHLIGTWSVIHLMKVKTPYMSAFKLIPVLNLFFTLFYPVIWANYLCVDNHLLKDDIDEQIQSKKEQRQYLKNSF